MSQKIGLVVLAVWGLYAGAAPLLEEYPDLKKFVAVPPVSPFRVGAGIQPLAAVGNKLYGGASLFVLNLESRIFDWDIVSLGFGKSFPKNSLGSSLHFAAKTVVRVRLFDFLSLGPLVGMEYVSFPKALSRMTNGALQTPVPEPFSARGLIYGGVLSQSFRYSSGSVLKINEVVYVQNYSSTDAGDGWTHTFEDSTLQTDPQKDAIRARTVLMVEINYLF